MNMFTPGETVSYKFILPFIRSDVGRIYVSYYQNNHIILEKTVPCVQVVNMSDEGKSYFTVSLSQEESLLFENMSDYFMQINIVFANGMRAASRLMKGTNGIQQIQEVVTSGG